MVQEKKKRGNGLAETHPKLKRENNNDIMYDCRRKKNTI